MSNGNTYIMCVNNMSSVITSDLSFDYFESTCFVHIKIYFV